MTTIHITRAPKRKKPKPGERKIIKGVEHVRCYHMVNIGTQWAPHYAYDRTGGRQRYEWVPVDQADLATNKRKRA